MDPGDCYFTKRAAEERLAAERASDPRARQCHLQMAAEYARRASASPVPDFAGRLRALAPRHLKIV